MILALFLINSVLIITAAASGYILGSLYKQSEKPEKQLIPPSKEAEKDLETFHKEVGNLEVKIDYPPQESSPISSIKPPTKEQIERKNMPKKYQESEEEMEKLLDDILPEDESEGWQ